jgi:hypothetical protein
MQVDRGRRDRVQQGDVYRDVDYIEYVSESGRTLQVSRIRFPLVVVLTQDCDLEQEHNERNSGKGQLDKTLISCLVAPMYNAEHFARGEHLSELGLKMQEIKWSRSDGDRIKQNSNPRYHYFEFPPESAIVPSVIDFKHYFSVNLQDLNRLRENESFVCTVSALFREALCQRFAFFLSRIALPNV